MAEAWRGFVKDGHWDVDVNVRNFIQRNYTPYDGDESFLEGPTEATDKLWGRLQELQKEEREHDGVLECETEVVSSLTAYGPGYIDESMKDLEQIVGLQTDKPLKRAFMPVLRWQKKLQALMVMKLTLSSTRSSTIIIRHTIRQYLMHILMR